MAFTREDDSYRAVPVTDVDALACVAAFDRMYHNGGAILARFETDRRRVVTTDPRDLLPRTRATALLRRLATDQLLPELQITEDVDLSLWWVVGPYQFEGLIVERLLDGGSYAPGLDDVEEARRLARSLVDAMVEDRSNCEIVVVASAWSEWFGDAAWDWTFLASRWRGQNWTLLALTDWD